MIRRRQFITLLGGAAAAWPPPAPAQQPVLVRRVGVSMNLAADDPQSAREISAFVDALKQPGWTPGSNLQIEYRWGAGDHDLERKYAPELVAFAPDVLLVAGGTTCGPTATGDPLVPMR
jgi:putative ABC transport system substrate-binding protein